jgi:hypothetical protein
MIVVLPYSTKDWGNAVNVLHWIKELGADLSRHQCLVIHAPDASEFEEGIVAAAREVFPAVGTLTTSKNVDGWPRSGNALFVAAALEVLKNPGYEGPWYFFEPDNTPTRPDFLDKLVIEYNTGGKPCLGAVAPTRVITKDGEAEHGRHMVGTGLYPKNFVTLCELFDTIRYTDLPWDVYVQWEVLPYCTETDSIQHIWNVQNARRKNKRITCDGVSEISQPVTVNEKALVVHGFKDGSLINLLREERDLEPPEELLTPPVEPKRRIRRRPVVAV